MADAELAGRVALVTGGNRGIGLAIAESLAAAGAAVSITGRDEQALADATASLEAAGHRVLGIRADVASEEEVVESVERTASTLGPVDVLVNNAALRGPTQPLHELAADEFSAVLGANLLGTFLMAKYVLPAMIERGAGSIVNIGSIAGVEAYPLRSPYATSKWGLVGLTRTLAAEVGPHGIRVNLVAPGPTEGEGASGVIARRAAALGMPVEELRARYESEIPLRRFVTGAETAAAVRFLASDAASGITGQSFCVSGGIEV